MCYEQVILYVIMFLVLVSVSLSVLEHSLIFSINMCVTMSKTDFDHSHSIAQYFTVDCCERGLAVSREGGGRLSNRCRRNVVADFLYMFGEANSLSHYIFEPKLILAIGLYYAFKYLT